MASEDTEKRRSRVLIVDDDSIVRKALTRMLDTSDFELNALPDAESACQWLENNAVDVVLTDIHMNVMSGMELLSYIKTNYKAVEVIMITAKANIEGAVAATRAGAFDYLSKPFLNIEGVIIKVRRAAKMKRLRDENTLLRQQVNGLDHPNIFVSRSLLMRQVLAKAKKVARANTTVLITGPTGSGKTALARGIHTLSQRPGDFIHVDCGAIPSELIEAQLFGHSKGAFTGAISDSVGFFREAVGGTILLDEIGNTPLALQAKLLRVLNDKVVRPVGGTKDIQVDVRVISATNDDLNIEVSEGRFREDLLYRLKVIELELPLLRNRQQDILYLAHVLLQRIADRENKPVKEISPEFAKRLRAHDWPGNIRELENVLAHAFVMSGEDCSLSVASLPEDFLSHTRPRPGIGIGGLVDLSKTWKEAIKSAQDAIRATYLKGVLEQNDYNITKAAAHAGLDRSNFRRHLRKHLPDYDGKDRPDSSTDS